MLVGNTPYPTNLYSRVFSWPSALTPLIENPEFILGTNNLSALAWPLPGLMLPTARHSIQLRVPFLAQSRYKFNKTIVYVTFLKLQSNYFVVLVKQSLGEIFMSQWLLKLFPVHRGRTCQRGRDHLCRTDHFRHQRICRILLLLSVRLRRLRRHQCLDPGEFTICKVGTRVEIHKTSSGKFVRYL